MAKSFVKCLWAFRSTLVVVLTPLLLLCIPINFPGKEGKCAYAIAIMAVYWMTEALPMAATALLPIMLFPFLGVIGSRDLCANYLKDTNFLFVAGLLIAVAVEKWNLHKRIALKVLCMVGSKPQWLMMGFMVTTCFLSMWLSNTATAAMLMPIAHAVLMEMDDNRKRRRDDPLLLRGNVCGTPDSEEHNMKDIENGTTVSQAAEEHDTKEHLLTTPSDDVIKAPLSPYVAITNGKFDKIESEDSGQHLNVCPEPPDLDSSAKLTFSECDEARQRRFTLEDKRFHDLCVGLRISIAFAANIGGTGTLTGTGPNIVLKGQVDARYGHTDLNFSSWVIFAVPNMVLCLIVAWLILMVIFIGPRRMFQCSLRSEVSQEQAANQLIKEEYKKLGDITFAEVLVLIMFIILAVAWMTRDPAFMPGWGSLPFLESDYITDACVGMSIACLLFMLPSRKPNFLCFRSKGDTSDPSPAPALLDWESVHKKLAWSVIIVLGGSFALADACAKSGLSVALGNMFNMFTTLPVWLLALVLSTITTGVTQITSNTATSTIFLPIVAQLAENMHVHPFYLMIPVAVSASLAFLLPVATPPNAIVFAYGNTRIIDMVKAGLMVNIICILILQLCLNSYGMGVFDLETYPEWAPIVNSTEQVVQKVLNTTTQPLINYTG